MTSGIHHAQHLQERRVGRLQLRQLDELVGGVGLGDVPGAEHHRVDARLGVQRRLGPERQVHRVPDAIAQQRPERRQIRVANGGLPWTTCQRSSAGAAALRATASSSAIRRRVSPPAPAVPTPPGGPGWGSR